MNLDSIYQNYIIYKYYFNCEFKSVFKGRLKKLALYFDDIFEITYHGRYGSTIFLISKIYDEKNNINPNNMILMMMMMKHH